MKKILFAASECVPFIKTGGLADVVGSLPKYFDSSAYDVRVILPKYLCIPEKWRSKMKYMTHFYTDFCWRNQYVGVLQMELEGVQFYFIDSEFYFGGPWPYHNMYEDIEKFSFFSKAVLSTLPLIGFRPDVIHCHDWQTGLIPVYLNDSFQGDPFFQGIKTVMTIHNLRFQGTWNVETIKNMTGLSDYYFTPDKLEHYTNGNLLKGGLVYADKITTVSKSYAREIQTEFYGEGLDGLMRARNKDLVGIVNGIDYEVYNPKTDGCLEVNFDETDFQKGKRENKAALQKELGLKEDPDKMMIGIISRLTDQKGFDLVSCVIEELCGLDVQLVVLGTGEYGYEEMFKHYAWKYPDKVSANIFYSEALSHKIYAACDGFLMPSLFEPCGLSQLMSLRYGTLPIVRETGGLKDTVEPYNEFENTGTGFSFANYNAHEMLATVEYAVKTYYTNRSAWDETAKRAMERDFSWNASAKSYEALYDDLLKKEEISDKQ
ncbi:glycogen synthase GlgA [Cuneatibacter caecimuris]|uniref:Glycogen synthase n=1 Tax=Cuneatibacter caecimuris TaxID=1796618 RepID=A0A4Q7P0I7_9FIRM|nr:glycogen synthase GlgA [Cuneatibacter caecimuris]RZS93057.1 starch synthase [Cuneatibacter caecimuris]